MNGAASFGPDTRWSILAEQFQIPLEKMKKIAIEPPFNCDYGCNIKFKGEFYSNFGLTVLDCAEVTLGERVIVAPNVQVYAATHSVDVAERQAGLERAYPVTVGDDCWIGGSAVLIRPCTIGNGCTVAVGAMLSSGNVSGQLRDRWYARSQPQKAGPAGGFIGVKLWVLTNGDGGADRGAESALSIGVLQ